MISRSFGIGNVKENEIMSDVAALRVHSSHAFYSKCFDEYDNLFEHNSRPTAYGMCFFLLVWILKRCGCNAIRWPSFTRCRIQGKNLGVFRVQAIHIQPFAGLNWMQTTLYTMDMHLTCAIQPALNNGNDASGWPTSQIWSFNVLLNEVHIQWRKARSFPWVHWFRFANPKYRVIMVMSYLQL